VHTGSIAEDSITAAARVYRTLCAAHGGWIGGWELQDAAKTTAVSTRVSEVRHQLPPGERVEMRQVGHQFFYRIVKSLPPVVVGQVELF